MPIYIYGIPAQLKFKTYIESQESYKIEYDSPFHEDEVFDFINGLTMTEDEPSETIDDIADWFQGICLY